MVTVVEQFRDGLPRGGRSVPASGLILTGESCKRNAKCLGG